MPFQLIATLIMAQGKPKIVTNFIIISSLLAIILLLFIGMFGFVNLIPLGIVIYYISFAILLYFYGRKNYGYSIYQLNRGIYDIINYVKSKRAK
jgi:peptidoglycan biosynthesis protein MviN/MurJ (putative lipid II flippase)